VIEESEIAKSIDELENSRNVKIQIEMSVWEAYSLIVALQFFTVTNTKLVKVAMVGELAARRLHESLRLLCPRVYILLNNGWNLEASKPKES
jgi:hypothetical protein